MSSIENLKYQSDWQLEDEEETILESREETQEMFNRVAFGGERILYNFNGAEVAIVPLEDYVFLEAFDDEI